MLCPQCGAEYREGFTTCADCNVPLIERPAEELSSQSKSVGFGIGGIVLIYLKSVHKSKFCFLNDFADFGRILALSFS